VHNAGVGVEVVVAESILDLVHIVRFWHVIPSQDIEKAATPTDAAEYCWVLLVAVADLDVDDSVHAVELGFD
jgi:hypothetical protein